MKGRNVKNPEPEMSVAGNPRHRKRNKKTGRFVSKKRKRRRNSLGTSAMEYMKSGQGIHRTKNSAVRAFDPKPMSKLQLQIGRNPERDVENLYLSIMNEGYLYPSLQRVRKRLAKSKRDGSFTYERGTRAFMNTINQYARDETRSRGKMTEKWSTRHPKYVRDQVAERLVEDFNMRFKVGEIENPLNKTNVRWKGKHKGPRKVRKASPQWWKISSYRANGRVVGHHIGQGTVRQAKAEAAKVSETRGIHRVVLTGPFKQKPMQRKKKR